MSMNARSEISASTFTAAMSCADVSAGVPDAAETSRVMRLNSIGYMVYMLTCVPSDMASVGFTVFSSANSFR